MNPDLMGWLGLVLIVATVTLWFRRAMNVQLSGPRAPFVLGWALGAALGIASLVNGASLVGGIPAGFAAAIGLFLLGLVGISRQEVAEGAVRVGDRLPEFTLPDDQGEPQTLSGLEGRPILLKFFRGHW